MDSLLSAFGRALVDGGNKIRRDVLPRFYPETIKQPDRRRHPDEYKCPQSPINVQTTSLLAAFAKVSYQQLRVHALPI